MGQGIFIAIDGIDGSGKTTLANNIGSVLPDFEPELTKEPTAESEWGRRLRKSAQEGRLPRDMEIEFFHKDRLHHIENFIRPNLQEGKIVICDRYVDSTLAFQAADPAEADQMYAGFAAEILIPDITFLLQCPVATGLKRINENRPEISAFEKVDTLERAQTIYQSRLGKGAHYVALDATGTPHATLCQALAILASRYPQLADTLRTHYRNNFPAQPLAF
jgi:dTMP kinase